MYLHKKKNTYCSLIHFIIRRQKCLLDLLSCTESAIPLIPIDMIVSQGSPYLVVMPTTGSIETQAPM